MLDQHTKAYWCVVNDSAVWLEEKTLPCGSAVDLNLPFENAICIGNYDNHPVMWLNDEHIEQTVEFTNLRELLLVKESLFLMISKSIQYGFMAREFRFCPQCGGRTQLNINQIAMQCNECRKLHYPRIFPSIIVAIRKDDTILLAQHQRHKGGLFTVLAGFVEVGETLEMAVEREVFEETGIKIKNIRYVGSQPWAFPSSLMMGYMADYDSGEIKVDPNELIKADWYYQDNLPELAPKGTIARSLIELTLDEINVRKNINRSML
ncbi:MULTISPECIES: NAD(+) diphosphatase [Aliivibrio]|uniref:NAD-capped RNA hydrolase NudC n=1 Tax=Aliivibrio sifiae TaxID=566293 RepID=A0A2S7XMB1_9GAMM|nr:NADH pyrophosphatase [Aliivibrio sifiae]GLR75602.1 NADH pyrophosphatase [Aliivibrio sifiae]